MLTMPLQIFQVQWTKKSDSSSLIKTYMMCKVTFLMQSDYKRDFELKECSAMLFFHDSVDSIYQQAKKK